MTSDGTFLVQIPRWICLSLPLDLASDCRSKHQDESGKAAFAFERCLQSGETGFRKPLLNSI
jgi:hypothetical protein